MYVRVTRPSSCRHDVECTTRGVSGYHLMAAMTSSPGLDFGERPIRRESACTGFNQKIAPSRMKTGRISRVWAVNSAAHAVVERGGPIVAINASSLPAPGRALPRGLPDGCLGLGRGARGHPPDRRALGGLGLGLGL